MENTKPHYVLFDRMTKEYVAEAQSLLLTRDSQQAAGFLSIRAAKAARSHYISNLETPYANQDLVEIIPAQVGF